MPADIQESHHALALRPGALLADRFRIVRSARGTSPFAFSYQAEDLQNGDAVVIKEFFPRSLVSRAADGLAVRPHSTDCERDFLRALHRFALEGAVLADLSHPHLVRVRSVVNANQTVYVVMDRHETQPLADFVQPTQGRIALGEQLIAASVVYEERSATKKAGDKGNAKPNASPTPASSASPTLPPSFLPIVRLQWPSPETLYLKTAFVRVMPTETINTFQRWHLLNLSAQAAVLK